MRVEATGPGPATPVRALVDQDLPAGGRVRGRAGAGLGQPPEVVAQRRERAPVPEAVAQGT